MINSTEVKLIPLHMYWHLHRKVNGKNYLGFSDHRLGLSIRTETDDVLKDCSTREFKIFKSFTTKEGKLIEYWDEPYTEEQIKSFRNLTLEQLESWVSKS